jgi:hypothetical protein
MEHGVLQGEAQEISKREFPAWWKDDVPLGDPGRAITFQFSPRLPSRTYLALSAVLVHIERRAEVSD